MPKIAFFYATFPRPTETFVRRELRALRSAGLFPHVYSLWKGNPEWEGIKINRFRILKLWSLPFWIPYWAWKRPTAFREVLTAMWSRPCPNLQNWNETFLGLGFALVEAKTIKSQNFDLFHGVWATMPTTAAFSLSKLLNKPFSMEAHAYDLFRKGGDWILREKLFYASMIRTSSNSSAKRLFDLQKDDDRVKEIRRGLSVFPVRKSFELVKHGELQMISVGRLVEKKGYFQLLNILNLFHRTNRFNFKMRIVGGGPLYRSLQKEIDRLGLSGNVILTGSKTEEKVRDLLLETDIMLFTGILAPNGDRDGIPNVIPEAMSAGCLILASCFAGASEAFVDGVSGFSFNPFSPAEWVECMNDFATNPEKYLKIRKTAQIDAGEYFNINQTVMKMIDVFKGIANKSK